MNLTTPTTSAVSDNIVAQIASEVGQSVPLLPKAFTRVIAKALAAIFILLYKYAGFSLLQMFVEYASTEETEINGTTLIPLVEIGRTIGVGDPVPGVRAELLVQFNVLNQTGTLPVNSQYVYGPTGVLYLTETGVTLDASTKQVTIRASSDQNNGDGSGAIGNLNAGDSLSLANPLPNVASTAAVVSQSVTGADAESWDSYRARIRSRFAQRPQGGALADYKEWAEEEAGIINAYPYRGDPGEINVYVEATPASSGSSDGIPTGAQLTAVAALIEQNHTGLAERRPLNDLVNVLAIGRLAFDVVVTGLVASDAASAHTAISEAVDEYLRAREPFIVGLSILPRTDRITQAAISGVVDEAASALGASVSQVSVSRSGSAVISYSLDFGQKAKLGTIAFV